MSTTVLIVDDHAVVRQGLNALLGEAGDFTVIAEAATGEDGLLRAAKCTPELAIVDLSLPGMTGFGLVSSLIEEHPNMRILVLSMHSDEAYIAEAFRSGAHGYIVKGAPSAEIITGLRAVAGGQRYVGMGVSGDLGPDSDSPPQPHTPFNRLTPREVEVLHLLAEGLTSKAIGEQLDIGARTVESHRSHMARKLDPKSSTDLLAYAMRHDLLTRPR
jgi:two-component system, NarL family, response regulator NreC